MTIRDQLWNARYLLRDVDVSDDELVSVNAMPLHGTTISFKDLTPLARVAKLVEVERSGIRCDDALDGVHVWFRHKGACWCCFAEGASAADWEALMEATPCTT